MKPLISYKKNVFSQNGEDGIIAEIFRRLRVDSGVCIEFGAWDGIHLSNIRNLVINGWTGIFIESDKERFNQLKKNYAQNKNVISINATVGSGINSLRAIFRRKGISLYLNKIDFLSIDIDGLDHHIFESLDFNPKLICIEANSAFSLNESLNQTLYSKETGRSLQCLTTIGESKNYVLICFTGNCLFLRKDLLEQTNLEELSVKEAYTAFLDYLTENERQWLFLVNLGLVFPYRHFKNTYLSLQSLHLLPHQIALAIGKLLRAKLLG